MANSIDERSITDLLYRAGSSFADVILSSAKGWIL